MCQTVFDSVTMKSFWQCHSLATLDKILWEAVKSGVACIACKCGQCLNLSNSSKFSTLQMCKTFQRNGNFCNTLYGRDFSGWCCLRLIDLAKKFHLMTLIGLGRLTYRGHLFPDDDLRVFGEKWVTRRVSQRINRLESDKKCQKQWKEPSDSIFHDCSMHVS